MRKNKIIVWIFIFINLMSILSFSENLSTELNVETPKSVEVYIEGKKYADFRTYKMEKLKQVLRDNLENPQTHDIIDQKIEILLKEKFDKFSDKELSEFIEALQKLKEEVHPVATTHSIGKLQSTAKDNKEQDMKDMINNYRSRTGQDLKYTFDPKAMKTIEITPSGKSKTVDESTATDHP